eukprot:m.189144 g.189144  ORF g.189144 m.189144 type:complete len:122 (+) comp10561_c0_seq16:2203-2568(+)
MHRPGAAAPPHSRCRILPSHRKEAGAAVRRSPHPQVAATPACSQPLLLPEQRVLCTIEGTKIETYQSCFRVKGEDFRRFVAFEIIVGLGSMLSIAAVLMRKQTLHARVQARLMRQIGDNLV